ncbi:MAG: DUF63 family protein [Candidatus Aenigmarchaeota archaeon]|nr:DUF63 family protein [Candidatus Aenigmarchaeota archaeon]
MVDFFQQYFVDPVIQGTGYNIYNTIAYALILIAAVFVTFKLLKKMNIKIDNRFAIGVLPYIILGGLLRSLEDAYTLGFWFKTPIIYIVIFAVAFTGLFFSKIIEMAARKPALSYHRIWAAIGFALVLVALTQVVVRSPFALAAMVTLSVFWTIALIFAKKFTQRFFPNFKLFSWENTAILAVHMFDASTTFVALTYFPYFEQHVLPGFLINIFGPAVMFALKFVVVAAVLHVLDKEMRELQQKKFIKIVIMILGLAPGLRNFFRLVMGV